MKRLSIVISFIFALFFIVSFFAPRQTLAQPTDTFDCEWVPSRGLCIVDMTTESRCAPGNCSNPVTCATTFQSVCESRIDQPCISCDEPPPPITPPPGSTCIGESTGLTGICKSTILGCGDGFMRDGSEGCNFGESCCVTQGVECGLAGGECALIMHNICPDVYDPTPVGGWGELGCGAQEACCRPLPAGCESVGVDLSCSSGYTPCPEGAGRCCIDTNDCPIFDPGWNGDVPEVKVPIFCVGDDPSDTTTDSDSGKLATAIGCIPIDTGQEFISFILRWAIGIAGGIAFLLILFAGFQIVTSSGDPKRLQSGRELLTAAIAGLMLLILSVFILRLIGYDLLGLPGFGQ